MRAARLCECGNPAVYRTKRVCARCAWLDGEDRFNPPSTLLSELQAAGRATLEDLCARTGSVSRVVSRSLARMLKRGRVGFHVEGFCYDANSFSPGTGSMPRTDKTGERRVWFLCEGAR